MRWRTTAVYLAILLLVGGYFYYFEVVKKEQREAAEKESRRVFSFKPESVGAIEIAAASGNPVRLEKKDGWRIVDPINTEVDKTGFDSFFSGLKNIDLVRKLGPAPENLEPYGLANPALRIRFQEGDQWNELLIGESNPSGEARYARKGGGTEIFLIDQISWQSLNKGLKDLRKKDLFAWQTDQVITMDVSWRDGEKVRLERQGESKEWKVEGKPDLKIKSAKVESLIDQIHWLRAVDFLDQNAKPAAPVVKITFKLKGDKTSELALADPDPAARQAVAFTSNFSEPVKVASHFFQELPKSAEAFKDRSIFQHNAAEVRELKWKRSGVEGSAVRTDDTKWAIGGKPMDDPWPITAILEDAAQVEYLDKAAAGPDLSGADANYLEFNGAGGKLGSIAWAGTSGESKETIALRLEQDGKISDVKVEHQNLRRLEEDLDELTSVEKEKKPL